MYCTHISFRASRAKCRLGQSAWWKGAGRVAGLVRMNRYSTGEMLPLCSQLPAIHVWADRKAGQGTVIRLRVVQHGFRRCSSILPECIPVIQAVIVYGN